MTVIALRYRAPDGREIQIAIPAPAAPELVRVLDEALERAGFVRQDEERS